MLNIALDKLVQAGTIKSYDYVELPDNSELIVICFPDDKTLTVQSWGDDASGLHTDTDAPGNYYKLTVLANSKNTKISIGDIDGHFVRGGHGLIETSLLEGEYTIHFGSESEQHIRLTENLTVKED